ncbi:cytochrome c biogenesis CcdA family protein [Patescibacteria group bacterium]
MLPITFDGSQLNFFIAFIAGFITFFASCLLPLVPTYLAYLSGVTITSKIEIKEKIIFRKDIFIHGVIFTIGFILIFSLLGAGSNVIGRSIIVNRLLFQKIGGLFFIFLGLFLMDVIHPSFLYKEWRMNTSMNLSKLTYLNSLFVGITFGFAWTPCIGPVLGVILLWASQGESVAYGMLLLIFYGVGLGLPFLIIAAFFDYLSQYLKKTARFGLILQKGSGVFIVFVGILLILGKMEVISFLLLESLHLNTLAF